MTAKIIADSINPDETRLTTMQLRYPRVIHAEFMTHRVCSRNASSSRAIPVERLIQDVLDDPFIPMHWGKNQKGMQAREECDELVKFRHDEVPREVAWLRARDTAVNAARQFAAAGYHKQIVNRLLEPFAYINVIVSSTQWSNFFALRDHPDAEPHIAILAREMKAALAASTPQELRWGAWHLPYVLDAERQEADLKDLIKISTARCARVSYMTHDGRMPNYNEDLQLADSLLGSIPLHASPAEHQARASMSAVLLGLNGNFSGGWAQHRKMLEGECQ